MKEVTKKDSVKKVLMPRINSGKALALFFKMPFWNCFHTIILWVWVFNWWVCALAWLNFVFLMFCDSLLTMSCWNFLIARSDSSRVVWFIRVITEL